MSNSEITALAREYAEGNPQIAELRLQYIREYEKTCEDFLRFLLRRFTLMEKSKVKNIHNGILVQLDPKNFGYSPYNQGRMDVIKSLFPDLGKEVER